MIDIEKLKARLLHEGLEETDELDSYYLINKHISRHLSALRFIKSNNLKPSSLVLSKLYRADVVIRQEINKVLMPIELSIVSKLQYFIEENNIQTSDLLTKKIFENVLDIPRRARKSRYKNNDFIVNTTTSIMHKWKIISIEEIIFQMTFGQIASVIEALPEEASKYIFDTTKQESIESLNNIVDIRNFIAHLGQLFINKDIRVSPYKTVTLKNFVEQIGKTAYGNYGKKLKETIDCYEERVINKLDRNDDEICDIKDMFHSIKIKLFGII